MKTDEVKKAILEEIDKEFPHDDPNEFIDEVKNFLSQALHRIVKVNEEEMVRHFKDKHERN